MHALTNIRVDIHINRKFIGIFSKFYKRISAKAHPYNTSMRRLRSCFVNHQVCYTILSCSYLRARLRQGLLWHSVQHLPTTMMLWWIRNIMKMNVRTIAKKWWMNSRGSRRWGQSLLHNPVTRQVFPSLSSQRFLLGMRVVEGAYDSTPFSLLVFIGVGSSWREYVCHSGKWLNTKWVQTNKRFLLLPSGLRTSTAEVFTLPNCQFHQQKHGRSYLPKSKNRSNQRPQSLLYRV